MELAFSLQLWVALIMIQEKSSPIEVSEKGGLSDNSCLGLGGAR